MEQQFLDDGKYASFINKNFIPYKIGNTPKTKTLIRNYFSHTVYTPAVLVLRKDGSEIDRLISYYKDPVKYRESLDNILTGKDYIGNFEKRYGGSNCNNTRDTIQNFAAIKE